MLRSLHSFTFFAKEHCVLLCSLQKKVAFFAFFYVLKKRIQKNASVFWVSKVAKNLKKECKRMLRALKECKRLMCSERKRTGAHAQPCKKYDFNQKKLSKLLNFCERKSIWAIHLKKSDSLIYHEWPERITHSCSMLICHEWPEQFALSRSFVLSDLSELLIWSEELSEFPTLLLFPFFISLKIWGWKILSTSILANIWTWDKFRQE